MTEKTSSTNFGVSLGFLEFLTLIFITLKLTDYIDWSWWWVLAPLWGQVLIFIVAFIFVVIYAAGKGTSARKKS